MSNFDAGKVFRCFSCPATNCQRGRKVTSYTCPRRCRNGIIKSLCSICQGNGIYTKEEECLICRGRGYVLQKILLVEE